MRAYVITTGLIFALIVAAHVARMYVEPHLLKDPLYLVLTLLSGGLAVWAWRIARRPISSLL